MSPGRDPALLLVAAANRAGLAARLRHLRALDSHHLRRALLEPTGAGPARAAIVAHRDALPAAIDAALERLPSAGPRLILRAHGVRLTHDATPGRVAFLFPGQGSEHAAMLRAWRARAPTVQAWFAGLDEAAREAGDPPPTRLLDEADAHAGPDPRRRRIANREISAALGSIANLALHELLTSLGVSADLHVGHSNGEHPAVIASGRVAAGRLEVCRGFVTIARISARLACPDREHMAALTLSDREALLSRIAAADGVYLAMDNSPAQVVVGGVAHAVDALAADIVRAGGVAMALPFSRAYHTPLFEDQARAFGTYYAEWPIGPARTPVYSCFSEAPLPDDADACREVMKAQWTAPVQFRSLLLRLHDEGVRTFVEVGPDARLTALVDDTLRGRPHSATSLSAPSRGDVEQLLHALADLFAAGIAIDPARVAALLDAEPAPATPAAPSSDRVGRSQDAVYSRAAVHERLMVDARAQLARMAALVHAPPPFPASPDLPFAGPIVSATGNRLVTARVFTRATDPFVDDHALGTREGARAGGYPLPVLPFTLSLEIAAEAARALRGDAGELRQARASRWLALDRGTLSTMTTVVGQTDRDMRVSIESRDEGAVPFTSFEVQVQAGAPAGATPPLASLTDGRLPSLWTPARFYGDYAFHRGAFQGLTSIDAIGSSGLDAALTVADLPRVDRSACVVDAAMLDCAGQLVAFWLLEHARRAPTFGVFPFAADRLIVHRPPPAAGATVVCRARIVLQDGVTTASVTFDTPDGDRLLTLEGFRQRLVQFPDWLAARIFSGDRAARPASLSADDADVLMASGGIWTRALAHLELTPRELDAFYAERSREGRLARLLPGAETSIGDR